MRSVVIIGCGRSGTSLAAGVLASAGYFMGDRLIPARETNPKGFYEDVHVNWINEDMMLRVLPPRPGWVPSLLRWWLFGRRPERYQLWLARVPLGTVFEPLPGECKRMQALVQRRPYCLKDPRFCYTLRAWEPWLDDAVRVCVFRDPLRTVNSILKECRTQSYLESLRTGFRAVMSVWLLMYRHVLEEYRRKGDWLFMHFDQLLSHGGLDCLAEATGAEVDYDFPDPALKRSPGEGRAPGAAARVYDELCSLAHYSPDDR